MNKPVDQSEFQTPEVTTGALPASSKVYTAPDAAPDLRVHRLIHLHPTANEPDLPVYDTSGPYSDDNVTIDIEKGLARPRKAWVLERGGVEEYEGRSVKPEDNGGAKGRHLAREFPIVNRPRFKAFAALGADHGEEERVFCEHRFGDSIADTEVHYKPAASNVILTTPASINLRRFSMCEA